VTFTDGVYDTAAHGWPTSVQWAAAVQTYRRAVDIYRHVLAIRAPRYGRVVRPAGTVRRLVVTASPPPSGPAGPGRLTAREREVAQLLARGFTNQQIAERLVVTRGTVANHVAHILDKLGLQNRTQVAAYLIARSGSEASAAPVPDAWVDADAAALRSA
jgi:DNA-binding NarL/FixJ family response regulator